MKVQKLRAKKNWSDLMVPEYEERKRGGKVDILTIKIALHCLDYRFISIYLSRLMGKPTICIGENKGADQLHGNREADQCLCFRYSDSTIPLLLKSEISSF